MHGPTKRFLRPRELAVAFATAIFQQFCKAGARRATSSLFLKRGVFRHKLNAGIIAGKIGATLRNNPSDVPFRCYEKEFFKELVADFQQSDDFKNNVLADAEIRKQLTKYYHARAARM
jgi:hypothetical protein